MVVFVVVRMSVARTRSPMVVGLAAVRRTLCQRPVRVAKPRSPR